VRLEMTEHNMMKLRESIEEINKYIESEEEKILTAEMIAVPKKT
jgi:hypothetical protein